MKPPLPSVDPRPVGTGVTAVILAGGRSRRFGRDKLRTEVAGRQMVAHVAAAAAAVSDRLVVSVREGQDRSALAALGYDFAEDRYPGAGPMAGLHAGLHFAETDWVLVVAGDMPYLTEGVLRRLLDAREEGDDAVVARTPEGRRHPLCACYHRRILPRVEACVRQRILALHALLDGLDSVRLVDLPGGPLRNVNRPSDLESGRSA